SGPPGSPSARGPSPVTEAGAPNRFHRTVTPRAALFWRVVGASAPPRASLSGSSVCSPGGRGGGGGRRSARAGVASPMVRSVPVTATAVAEVHRVLGTIASWGAGRMARGSRPDDHPVVDETSSAQVMHIWRISTSTAYSRESVFALDSERFAWFPS